MKTLFLDASTPTLYVGAYEGGSWLKLLRAQASTLENLFGLAADLFAIYPLNNFDRLVVCEGPGRLMSLRIASVAANQWASGRACFTFNSLQLASRLTGTPTAYELRTGHWALWQGDKIEVVQVLPQATTLMGSAATPAHDRADLYAQAVESFPAKAEELLTPVSLFDPPLWAPFSYALATPKALSKEG